MFVISNQYNVYKKLCYRRRTALRAMSVRILSTVETCTTNPQIAVMELDGYSWPTRREVNSKQSRLVGCSTGVVNKLDRPSTTTTRFVDNTIDFPRWKVPSLWQSLRGKHPNFLEIPKFPYWSAVWEVELSLPAKTQLDSSIRFDTTPACDGQTDGRMDGHTTTAYAALA